MPEDSRVIDRAPVPNLGETTDTTHALLRLLSAAAKAQENLTSEGVLLMANWQQWIESQTEGQVGSFGGVFTGTDDDGKPYERTIIVNQALEGGKKPVLVSVLSVDMSRNPYMGVEVRGRNINIGRVGESDITMVGSLYDTPTIRAESEDPEFRSLKWGMPGYSSEAAVFDSKSRSAKDPEEVPNFTGVARHEFELVRNGVGNLTAGYKLQRKIA